MTKAELYQKLMSANDLHNALADNFSFLADSDGFMAVLKAIMKQVESIELEDDGYGRDAIYLRFPNDEKEFIYGEIENEDYSAWPLSYQKIVASCMYILFPDDSGWALQLGNETYSSDEIKNSEFNDSDSVILSPLSDFSDWWMYHPTKKNSQGEPLLCLVSHENMEIVRAVNCNIGSLFLKRIAERLGMSDIVPDVVMAYN